MPAQVPAPFTTVFRASETHKIKRNRQTVSCTACQKRKLRCDKRRPCGACEKRGHQATCFLKASENDEESKSIQEIMSRLSKLEDMARGLSTSQHDDSQPTHDESFHRTNVTCQPNMDDTTIYHSSSSWATLMEGIHGIRSTLAAEYEQSVRQPDIVFGDLASVSIEDILHCLPPRRETDGLMSAFFNSKFLALPFLHTHHFRQRYDAFWESPSSANLLWVSILLSIISVGATISSTKDLYTSTFADPEMFMVMSARCLVSGHYAQADTHSVEAILAHIHCRGILSKSSGPVLWSLHGLVIRVAQRLGYHRNPQTAKLEVTPFEVEMRRRVWSTIRLHDVTFSSQHGMPPMVHEEDCDAELPTSLMDEDFDEDCIELPLERPADDPTLILFHIYKAKLLPTLCRINRRALGIQPSTAKYFMELCESLDDWHKSIPPCLAYRPIDTTAFADANHTIMYRIMLELIYLKSQGLLYCPYIISIKGLCHERAKSMDLCRKAALRIMDIHLEVDQEMQPGFRFYEDRNIISSLTLSDFLNAAMFICVDMTETEGMSAQQREAQIDILKRSFGLWLNRCDESQDAKFACRVLQAILTRVGCSHQALTPAVDELTSRMPSSGSPDAADEMFTMNGNPGSGNENNRAEQIVDFENLSSFDAFFTDMDSYSWNSITQLSQNEWMGMPFPST